MIFESHHERIILRLIAAATCSGCEIHESCKSQAVG